LSIDPSLLAFVFSYIVDPAGDCITARTRGLEILECEE
jgi:hypothetical protein